MISQIATQWLEKNEDAQYIHGIKNEIKVFTFIVNRFRSLSYRHKQKYGALNRYFLSLLITQIGNELNQEQIPTPSSGLLLMYTEVAFYIFSLDMNVTSSIKICRVLEYLYRWAKICADKTILSELETRIRREVKRCLDIYETNHKDNETNIEVFNLLLCLKRLMNSPIPRSQLVNLFNISEGHSDNFKYLNYFQICTLLYIIGDNSIYEDIRLKIIEDATRRIKNDPTLYRADNAMLFFDLIVCPYIKKKEVKEIIIKVYKCSEASYGKKYKELTKTKRWFFNWDISKDLSELISKKEYHSPYE